MNNIILSNFTGLLGELSIFFHDLNMGMITFHGQYDYWYYHSWVGVANSFEVLFLLLLCFMFIKE
jgi:hypothetical protein